MKTTHKKIGKIFQRIVLFFALFIFLFAAFLKSPWMEGWMGKLASHQLSRLLEMSVSIQTVEIEWLNLGAQVNTVMVKDHKNEILFAVDKIEARLENLKFSPLSFRSVRLDHPTFNIVLYKGDTINNFMSMIKKMIPETPSEESFVMLIGNIVIENGNFIFDNQKRPKRSIGLIDFSHIGLSEFYFRGKDVAIIDDSIACNIRRISLKEKSGFELLDFASHFSICSRSLRAYKTNFVTNNSQMDLDLVFDYKIWRSYASFTDSVFWNAEIDRSWFNTLDLAFFAEALQGADNKLHLSAKTKGCVNNFNLDNLFLQTGNHTLLRTSLSLKDVTKPTLAFLDAHIYNMQSSLADLNQLQLPEGKKLELPASLQNLTSSQLSARFLGTYDDFSAQLNAYTNYGNVLADISYTRKRADIPIFFQGVVKTKHFKLGEIVQKEKWLGKVDLDLSLMAKGSSFDSLDYFLEGNIPSLEIAQMELKNIELNAQARTNYFFGQLAVDDEKLNISFDGLLDFEREIPLLHYDLDIFKMDLAALQLLPRDNPIILSTHIFADHEGMTLDSMIGDIHVENTTLKKADISFFMDTLTISTKRLEDGNKRTILSSDVFDLKVEGLYYFEKMPYIYQNAIAYYIPALKKKNMDTTKKKTFQKQNFQLEANFKNTEKLFELFLPNAGLASDATLRMNYSSDSTEYLWSLFTASYVQYANIIYQNTLNKIETNDNKLSLSSYAQKLELTDSLKLEKFYVEAVFPDKDTIEWGLSWNNDKMDSTTTGSEKGRNYANIKGDIDFSDQRGFYLRVKESDLFFANEKWDIYTDAFVKKIEDEIEFHDFGIRGIKTGAAAYINGQISHKPSSVLSAVFNQFKLSDFDFLSSMSGLDISAELNGEIRLENFYDETAFSSDLEITDVYVDEAKYGDIFLKATTSEKGPEGIYVSLKVVDSQPTMELAGHYYPKTKNMEFHLQTARFPVDGFGHYIESFAEGLHGYMSGETNIRGLLTNPQIEGRLQFTPLDLKISVLNTPYRFDSLSIVFNSKRFSIQNGMFYDTLKHTQSILKGSILHNNLRNFSMNLDILLDKTLTLNTKISKQSVYSGSVFASGLATLRGHFNNIILKADIKTDKHSFLNFNTGGQGGADEYSFIQFINPIQDSINLQQTMRLKRLKSKKEVSAETQFTLVLNVDANTDLSVGVDIKDAAMAGQLLSKGDGALRFQYRIPGDDMSLFGTYAIHNGTFDFTMQNLLNKMFSIKNGGTIAWTGKVTEADINVQAIYATRTSLSPVIGSVAGVMDDETLKNLKRKVNVESMIELTGKLMSPQIQFDINLLNVDTETKDLFFSVVNKENQSEMLKQTFSLLLMNSFIPSGGDNSLMPSLTDAALASSTEIIFSQFNNVLSKLSKDFDVGVNFRPEDNTTTSEFQVMMSGSLFNDRLIIDGNLGIGGATKEGRSSTNSSTNVVGDINVEWKFTEKFRLKAFNRSNERDLMRTQSNYTQGIGVVYTVDFNHFSDLIHKGKRKLKKINEPSETSSKSGLSPAP